MIDLMTRVLWIMPCLLVYLRDNIVQGGLFMFMLEDARFVRKI